ncbi:MAG: iron-containing alcohol dehydrogenase, partial [Roseibium sp.]
SNALVLPHVLTFNNSVAAATYAEIAPAVFPQLTNIADGSDRAELFAAMLTDLSRNLGLHTRLRDVGIGKKDLPKLASDAMKQTRLLVNNPKEITEADAFEIYRAAL